MKAFIILVSSLLASVVVLAGVQVYNGTQNLGVVSRVICSTGTTCTKTFNDRATLTLTGAQSLTTLAVSGSAVFNGGVSATFGSNTTHETWPTPTLTSGTSTTPSVTTVYVADVYVPINQTMTGIAVNNAGTCGTNKYIVALFNANGTVVANSALAGVLCSGTSAWQKIPFINPTFIIGPGIYYVGVYMNGTTDRFYAIPAVGAFSGYSGTITGQTFGIVANITPPTTFTADSGPVAYTY